MRLGLLLLLTGCGAPGQSPEIVGSSPSATCESTPRTELRIAGQNLGAVVTGALDDPTVHPPGVILRPSGAVPGTEQPTESITVDVTTWSSTTLTVAVASGDVPAGVYDVGVTPFEGEVTWHASGVAVLADPVITTIDPPSVCTDLGSTELRILGTGFPLINSALPSVRISGEEVTVRSASGCVPLGPAGVEICDTLIVDVVGTERPIGVYSVDVTGPAEAACTAVPNVLEISPPPTLFAIDPSEVCELGGQISLTGDNFAPGMSVHIGETEATVLSIDDTTAQVATPALEVGTHDITLSLGDGCIDRQLDALVVRAQPLTYALQPATLWTGLASEVRVFVSGFLPQVDSVTLTGPDNIPRDLTYRYEPDSGVVLADVPSDLPAGEYAVLVGSGNTCGAANQAVLTIVELTTIPIADVEPAYVWQYDARVVEITGPATLAPGEKPFTPTLSAAIGGPSGTIPLLALTWRAADRMTATIPDSLLPGSYDLVLTDIDGAIGALETALEITSQRPPNIDNARPNSLSTNGDGLIEIEGSAFDNPTVILDCLDDDVPHSEPAPLIDWTARLIRAAAPVSEFSGSTVCIVEVTNADGAVARYSAISIRSPSQNLFPFTDGPDLNIARRAPAATAGRTGGTSRFVYAIGGDSGTPSSAMNSVEVASIGAFGEVDPWRYTTELPDNRTLASAVTIRQFVYVVGGDDGLGAVDTGLAARILDPLNVPRFTRVDLVRSTTGLESGGYRYTVAARFDANADGNPGGESLPSESLPVEIPEGGDGLDLTLSWTAVPGAAEYRLYRSQGTTQPALLATVSDTTWTDTGDEAVDATQRPLADGDLGTWQPIPPMNTPRSDACAAIVDDPRSDPEVVYLYMAGGEDASGDLLDTIEVLDVRIEGPNRHRFGTWRTESITLSSPRRGCAAFGIDSANHTVVPPGETWLYIAGGFTDSSTTGDVDAFPIGVAGGLSPSADMSRMRPSRAGFGAFAASNFLYVMGGANGTPSEGGASAEMLSNTFPDVRNWNSLGLSLAEPRLYMGVATESAVAVIFGGQTTEPVTDSTEWTRF